MGKNYKEQAAYDYLHENKPVKFFLLIKLFKKWRRYNWDIGEARHRRNQLKEKSYD